MKRRDIHFEVSIRSKLRGYKYTAIVNSGKVRAIIAGCRVWHTWKQAERHYTTGELWSGEYYRRHCKTDPVIHGVRRVWLPGPSSYTRFRVSRGTRPQCRAEARRIIKQLHRKVDERMKRELARK